MLLRNDVNLNNGNKNENTPTQDSLLEKACMHGIKS